MTTHAGTIDGAAANLIGVVAAARELGCHHSTVSRYVKNHHELNHGTDKRPKIDLDEFRRHHAENTNRARAGSHAGRLFGEDDDLDADADADGEKAAGKSGDVPTYALAKGVREGILAQRARIELDELRGLLVPRAEVEDQAFEAGQRLQHDLLELGAQLAERLAAMADPREIAALLESEHRRVLAKLAAALRSREETHAAA